MDLSKATEQELRETKVIWPKTEEELSTYIKSLVEREHDYGTCVYAMSMAALATFYYVSHKLGVTGFQASCADMDFIGRSRNMKNGFRIINYHDLLYPQNLDQDHFPGYMKLIQDNKEWLSKEAKKELADSSGAHNEVRNHWEYLVSLSAD